MPWTSCWTVNLVLLAINIAALTLSLRNAIIFHYYWKLVVARLRKYPEAALPACDARVRLAHLQDLAWEQPDADLATCAHLVVHRVRAVIQPGLHLLHTTLSRSRAPESLRAARFHFACRLLRLVSPLRTLQIHLDEQVSRWLDQTPRLLLRAVALDTASGLLVRLWQRLEVRARHLGRASLPPTDPDGDDVHPMWTDFPPWDPAWLRSRTLQEHLTA